MARIKKDEGVNKASKDLYELALSGRDLIFYKNFKPDKTSVHDEHKFEINGQNPSIRFKRLNKKIVVFCSPRHTCEACGKKCFPTVNNDGNKDWKCKCGRFMSEASDENIKPQYRIAGPLKPH